MRCVAGIWSTHVVVRRELALNAGGMLVSPEAATLALSVTVGDRGCSAM